MDIKLEKSRSVSFYLFLNVSGQLLKSFYDTECVVWENSKLRNNTQEIIQLIPIGGVL